MLQDSLCNGLPQVHSNRRQVRAYAVGVPGTAYPIDELMPGILASLAVHPRLLVEAPPGAGKTTRVPVALLGEDWLGGRKIVMLEPRRVAARAAAGFMARQLGEEVGATVGYRVRFDSRVGPSTRIEVVTEGILARMLQDDPMLDGIGAVLFDEVHERHLAGDLALALALDVQAGLREDLRIVLMSATLDGERLARWLDAPRLASEGRSFPVWCAKPSRRTRATCWCSCRASAKSHGRLRRWPMRRSMRMSCSCTASCRSSSSRACCNPTRTGAAAWCWRPTSRSRA